MSNWAAARSAMAGGAVSSMVSVAAGGATPGTGWYEQSRMSTPTTSMLPLPLAPPRAEATDTFRAVPPPAGPQLAPKTAMSTVTVPSGLLMVCTV